VQVPPWRQFEKHVQQTHGIRAAGYRNRHPLARLEHAEALDRVQHLLDHVPILALP